MPIPTQNDDVLLNDFIIRDRAVAAQVFQPISTAIRNRYAYYRAVRGNPWDIDPDNDLKPFKQYFHSVYETTPKTFEFIDLLRNSLQGACPMCGATGNGTLDHYLPKATYPEFSFLSINLVPCCTKCNVARNNSCKGEHRDARPLHPYFDPIMAQALIEVEIIEPYAAPRFQPKLLLAPNHPSFHALAWHVENVVAKAKVDQHWEHYWGRLIAKPLSFLGRDATSEAVRLKLIDLLNANFAQNDSQNGWDVCFLRSLIVNVEAVSFLRDNLEAKLSDANHNEATGMERLYAQVVERQIW